MSQHEDGPPAVRPTPVPNELQQLEPERRETMVPEADANWHMVRLSLSSMATTLEDSSQRLRSIEAQLEPIPELVTDVAGIKRTVVTIENQHVVMLDKVADARGTANLAGGMAASAQEEASSANDKLDRVLSKLDLLERVCSELARSVSGLVEANNSIYPQVFPPRQSESDGYDEPEVTIDDER